MHSVKAGLKDALAPQLLFADLGLKYVGPIDGHDEHAVEVALRDARSFSGPVVVHVATRKGMGYPPAESDVADQMHSCGVIDPVTGTPATTAGPSWTAAFADALIGYAGRRRDIVAITAAMPGPTGLNKFGACYPDRLFDVGIAEQHAPRDAARLREQLGEALSVDDGPTALRFPKDSLGEDIPTLWRHSGIDVLAAPAAGRPRDVLFIAVGSLATVALGAAARMQEQGFGVTVVDPRWVLPVPHAVVELAAAHRLVVTVEDGVVSGGVGAAVSAALRRSGIDVACRDIGVPQQFLDQGSRSELLAEVGLDDCQVAKRAISWVLALRPNAFERGAVRSARVERDGHSLVEGER